MITKERIEAIRKRLLERASTGDWQRSLMNSSPRAIFTEKHQAILGVDSLNNPVFRYAEDAEFAAHAPRDVYDLLQRCGELERVVNYLLDGVVQWAADEDNKIHQNAFDPYVVGCIAVGRTPPADDR